ncbi:MAG: hypothetical protein LBI61_00355 [Puniceicoccales bacterium]|jgi:hypothetical protein|nr:hypothetical protein [Puniceicoccales bacterium]
MKKFSSSKNGKSKIGQRLRAKLNAIRGSVAEKAHAFAISARYFVGKLSRHNGNALAKFLSSVKKYSHRARAATACLNAEASKFTTSLKDGCKKLVELTRSVGHGTGTLVRSGATVSHALFSGLLSSAVHMVAASANAAMATLSFIKRDVAKTAGHLRTATARLNAEASKFTTSLKDGCKRLVELTRSVGHGTGTLVRSGATVSHALFSGLLSSAVHMVAASANATLGKSSSIFHRTISAARGICAFARACASRMRRYVAAKLLAFAKAVAFAIGTSVRVAKYLAKKIFTAFSIAKLEIYSVIRNIKNAIVKFFLTLWKAALSPFILSHALAKRCALAVKNTAILATTATGRFFLRLPSTLKREFDTGKRQALGIFRRPAAALSLTLTIVAFIGLKVYDSQMSKIEYNSGMFAAKHAKKMLRQKQYVLHGYTTENTASKYKNRKVNRSEMPMPVVASKPDDTAFAKTVDSFFSNHIVSEVMCSNGSCKMKIDDKIVGNHFPLAENSEIFIADTDGERVVFADLSGNRYAKSIESLFGR